MTKPSLAGLGKGGVSGVAAVPTQCPAGAFLVIHGHVEVPGVSGSETNAFSHSDGRRAQGSQVASLGMGLGC